MSISINQQDLEVAEYLKACGIKYTVISTQTGAFDGDWEHDKWLALIDGQSFEYSTGTGHRKAFFGIHGAPSAKDRKSLNQLREITGFTGKFPQTKELRRSPNKSSINFESYARALPPTSASVIYALILDADCATDTFSNWCADFGYNTDSIKAQKTYFACQQIFKIVFFRNRR